MPKLKFVSSFTIPLISCFFIKVQSDNCQLFPEQNFSGPPYSLQDEEIIFNTNLSLRLPSSSIKLQDNCKLLACSLSQLQGECVEHSESTLINNKSISSASCKCSGSQRVLASGHKQSRELPVLEHGPCGTLFLDWHFTGPSQQFLFPGSAAKLEINGIRSARISSYCEITMWKRLKDAEVSFTIGDSVSYINPFDKNQGGHYNWGCCYCDVTSQKICSNAKNISMNYSNPPNETTDFSQFVKYGKKIIGIGRNYRWTASELTKVLNIPESPIVFLKPSTSYIQEGQKIQLPTSLGPIYYEVELGVVIGKSGKFIKKSEALDHVAGYFIAFDMTAKEFLKRQNLPWEIGKGFDTSCPVSHFIPKHLIPNPNNVHLECQVNGNVTQSDNTKNMIFDVPTLISYVSRYMTLQTFDTILTGTPDGLGSIQAGDILEATLGNFTKIKFEIENIDEK